MAYYGSSGSCVETVRALHQTIASLRTALEESRNEISDLKAKNPVQLHAGIVQPCTQLKVQKPQLSASRIVTFSSFFDGENQVSCSNNLHVRNSQKFEDNALKSSRTSTFRPSGFKEEILDSKSELVCSKTNPDRTNFQIDKLSIDEQHYKLRKSVNDTLEIDLDKAKHLGHAIEATINKISNKYNKINEKKDLKLKRKDSEQPKAALQSKLKTKKKNRSLLEEQNFENKLRVLKSGFEETYDINNKFYTFKQKSASEGTKIIDHKTKIFENRHKTTGNRHKTIEDRHKAIEGRHKTIEDGHKTIEGGHTTIEDGQRSIVDGRKRIEDGCKTIEDGRRLIEGLTKTNENKNKTIEDRTKIIDRGYKAIENKHKTIVNKHKKIENKPKTIENEHKTIVNKHKTIENKDQNRTSEGNTTATENRNKTSKENTIGKTIEETEKAIEEDPKTIVGSAKIIEDSRKTIEDSKNTIEGSTKTIETYARTLEDDTVTNEIKNINELIGYDAKTIAYQNGTGEDNVIAIKSQKKRSKGKIIENRNKTSEDSIKTVEDSIRTVEDSTKTISCNRKTIEDDRKTIEDNRETIKDNRETIEDKRKTIEDNTKTIQSSASTIGDITNTPEDSTKAVGGTRKTIDNTNTIKASTKTIEDTTKAIDDSIKTTAGSIKTIDDSTKTIEYSTKAIEDNRKTIEDSAKSIEGNTKTIQNSRKTVAGSTKTIEGSTKTTDNINTIEDSTKIIENTIKTFEDNAETTEDGTKRIERHNETIEDRKKNRKEVKLECEGDVLCKGSRKEVEFSVKISKKSHKVLDIDIQTKYKKNKHRNGTKMADKEGTRRTEDRKFEEEKKSKEETEFKEERMSSEHKDTEQKSLTNNIVVPPLDLGNLTDRETCENVEDNLENDAEQEVDDIELIFTTDETKETDFKEELVPIDTLLQCPLSDYDEKLSADTSDRELEDDVFNDGYEPNRGNNFERTASNVGGGAEVYNSKSDNSIHEERSTKSYYSFQDSSFENKSLEKDESFDRFEEKVRIVETDISKIGIQEPPEYNLGRRNTCPNPVQYRPIAHREALSRNVRKNRPILVHQNARKDSEAQTNISAIPGSSWRSESSLAHKVKIGENFTTLPSKFPHPGSRLQLSEKTVEARRILLSDIGFTSMVPELSRSADHLCPPNVPRNVPQPQHYGQFLRTTDLYSPAYTQNQRYLWSAATPSDRSNSQSRYSSQFISSPPTLTRRCSAPVSPSKKPLKTTSSRVRFANGSLPELRTEWMTVDSGESTDSLVEEAEHYLRRSIDCLAPCHGNVCFKKEPTKTSRRASAPEPSRDNVPPQGWQPFLPRVPRDLHLDYWVKVITAEGRVRGGRVRYVGPLNNQTESYVGVQLSNPDGQSDGTYNNRRYFNCEPYHGLFIPFKKIIMGWRP